MNNTLSDSEQSVSGAALDCSNSNSSSSSSATSTTSSTTDSDGRRLDTLELATINNETLQLPRGLCESAAIFHEFCSAETWNMLAIPIREHLQKFLPHFTNLVTPQEAAVEKQRTLVMFFNGDLRRFGHSPLIDLQHELEDGGYRPDVLRLRQSIAKSRRREQRFQKCERISQLAKDLFLSRERLLRIAYKSAPETKLRAERSMKRLQNTLRVDNKLCTVRSRKRFYKEMENITEQFGIKVGQLSADEEEAESDDMIKEDFNRKQKIDVSTVLKTPALPIDRFIYSTLFKRRQEFADEDAVRADHQMQQTRLSNRNFRTYIRAHKRRKLTEPTLPDFETSDIRLRDVCARAQMGSNFKDLFRIGRHLGRKSKSKILPNVTTSEPPALVPIQTNDRNVGTSRNSEYESIERMHPQATSSPNNIKEKPEALQFKKHLGGQSSSSSIQHPFLPEDGAPFNILDGEVELQQEEVETFGSCEETLQRFVISNEVVLPAIEQSDLPPQKLLQTPHKEENAIINLKCKQSLNDNVVEHNIPKLEPIRMIPNRSFLKEKARTISQLNYSSNILSQAAAAIVTPIKRQTQAIADSAKSIGSGSTHAVPSDLIQETHACFFSLIRDLFCATTHHRMQYNELRTRIDSWLRNPITALNDWYAHADNWQALLMSAIHFLAGDFSDQPDEYVPYIEFKPQINFYQWIGAGRDSDTRLSTLCNYWLQRRNDMSEETPAIVGTLGKSISERDFYAAETSNTRRQSIELEELPSSYDGGVSPPPPPPPRYPTTWTVCAATRGEVVEFQRQERERFEQPHRAYTYRMHGYESVVGPVKGIYTQMYALTKARGHSMMVVNRPNFVTILTLVRDATARLPNGEGTRADIAELLKSSQYINLKEGENVLQTTVSGALDRMHTEHDPCVRYDPKRKIWIYLHRNRSECDFERIHQQQQGLGKAKKVVHRKSKTKATPTGNKVSNSAEINDNNNINIVTGDDEPNVGNLKAAINTPKISTATTFSMPALVPSNPIIVSSQSGTNKAGTIVAKPPSINRSLPVPPLKYNIPHQQQKSLLKTTVQSHTQRNQLQSQQQHQQKQQIHQQQINTIIGADTQLHHNQRIQQRVVTFTKNASQSNELLAEVNKTNKKLNLVISPTKTNLSQLTAGSGGSTNSTPIIVATPSGLQTIHVSNATVVTSQAQGTTSHQKASSLNATLTGKKVALNKPIIISQIRGQSTMASASTTKNKLPSPQILKQQNTSTSNAQQQKQQQQTTHKQAHSFIIPISMANSMTNLATDAESQNFVVKETNMRSLPVSVANNEGATTTTIYMDSSGSAQFISNVERAQQEQPLQQPQQKQQTAKNIIRLVPSISSGGVKSILQSTASPTGGASKQGVHVIGHRVVTAGSGSGNGGNLVTTVRAQTQQGKAVGNISLINTSGVQTSTHSGSAAPSVVTASSGSTLIKMSPHTFATLQQKQGQHIVVKQSPTSSTGSTTMNQQQRVIDKATFIRNSGQSSGQITQTIGKQVFMQQSPTGASTVVQKSVVSGAASIASQTSGASPAQSSKVHTINASNLTAQQQRVLLQNIKQQQQHKQQNIQFKSVQVVSSNTNTSQIQNQLTIQPSQIIGGVPIGQQANNKAITVMVSQPQNISRIIQTASTTQSQQQHHQQSQQQQHQAITITSNDSALTATSTGGTRILTTSTGQIISLESLLQKQNSSGSLKITQSNSVGTIVKNLQTANVIQQQQQQAQQSQIIGSAGNTTYTVVSQATTKYINTARNSDNANATITKTALVSGSGAAGRILVSSGGQMTAPQIAKVIGKAGGMPNNAVAPTATTACGNIRVIKNATNVGVAGNSFNIDQLQGKQVVFATKPATTVAKNVGNVIQAQQLQSTGMVIGGQTVKAQKNTHQQQQNKVVNTSLNNSSNNTIGVIASQSGTSQMQTVIMGNQILRVQQMPTTVKNAQRSSGVPVQQRITTLPVGSFVTTTPASSNNIVVTNNGNNNESGTSAAINLPKTVVLGTGGQTIRLQQSPHNQTQSQQIPTQQTPAQMVTPKNAVQQATKASNVGRVVLAVQGGGQIFLSQNFQGNTLNMKSLQNMKVVSLTPRPGSNTAASAVQQQTSNKSASAVVQQQSSGGGSNS